jgi:hypothetical protein
MVSADFLCFFIRRHGPKQLNTTAVAGGIVGGTLAIIAIIVAIFLIRRKRWKAAMLVVRYRIGVVPLDGQADAISVTMPTYSRESDEKNSDPFQSPADTEAVPNYDSAWRHTSMTSSAGSFNSSTVQSDVPPSYRTSPRSDVTWSRPPVSSSIIDYEHQNPFNG